MNHDIINVPSELLLEKDVKRLIKRARKVIADIDGGYDTHDLHAMIETLRDLQGYRGYKPYHKRGNSDDAAQTQ